MSSIQHLHPLVEKLVETALASLARRPMPISGHQAAAELYAAVDQYADAVLKNQPKQAKASAEKLAVETLRVLCAYQQKAQSVHIDSVRMQSAAKSQDSV